MALTEAIAHLNKGMELIDTLPASTDRDGSELALRVPLGTAWMALKGWPAAERHVPGARCRVDAVD
jgi:hypothetical protein